MKEPVSEAPFIPPGQTGQYGVAQLVTHTHTMPGAKNFSIEDKRVAIGLKKAGVPLKKIMEQLQMSKLEVKKLWVQRMEDSSYLRSLVQSMPRRLQAVIQNNGNATKYKANDLYKQSALFWAKIASKRDIFN